MARYQNVKEVNDQLMEQQHHIDTLDDLILKSDQLKQKIESSIKKPKHMLRQSKSNLDLSTEVPSLISPKSKRNCLSKQNRNSSKFDEGFSFLTQLPTPCNSINQLLNKSKLDQSSQAKLKKRLFEQRYEMVSNKIPLTTKSVAEVKQMKPQLTLFKRENKQSKSR